MKCIAVRSAGRETSEDYTSRDFGRGRGKIWLAEAVPFLDEGNPSVAIIKQGTWLVLAMSLDTSRFDRTNIRKIKNTVLWECENQNEARGLAAAALGNWDSASNDVDKWIVGSSDPKEAGWHADAEKLGTLGLKLSIESNAKGDAPLFASRGEKPYTSSADGKGPESAEWKTLADELRNNSLPEEDRFHVCVTGWPTEKALAKLRVECTRLLHKGVEKDQNSDEGGISETEWPDNLNDKVDAMIARLRGGITHFLGLAKRHPFITLFVLLGVILAATGGEKKKASNA